MIRTPHDTLHLPDGRRLAYLRCGAAQGFPVFYHHGTPSCRLEARMAEAAARAEGLSLIAPDRPGFGCSDFQPGRRFADWPSDLLALADHLGIARFGIAGHSGAGPHLLACGARLPRERLAFIGALAPWGSASLPQARAGMNRLDRAFAGGARTWPGAMRLGFAPMGWAARHAPQLFLRLLRASVSEADRAALADPLTAARFADMMAEAFRQGSRGAAHEAALAYGEWGFDPGDIRVPVHLHFGTEDVFVPDAMARHLAETIPGAQATWRDGAGHLDFDAWHDIFAVCRGALDAAA